MTKAKKGQRKWLRKRIIAAGLNAAREEDGKVKPKPGMHKMPDKHMMEDENMEGMMPKKKARPQVLREAPMSL